MTLTAQIDDGKTKAGDAAKAGAAAKPGAAAGAAADKKG